MTDEPKSYGWVAHNAWLESELIGDDASGLAWSNAARAVLREFIQRVTVRAMDEFNAGTNCSIAVHRAFDALAAEIEKGEVR